MRGATIRQTPSTHRTNGAPAGVRASAIDRSSAPAEALAWDAALRGYDAVQLASALILQESVGADITLATFDRQLWGAGKQVGIHVWPKTLKD